MSQLMSLLAFFILYARVYIDVDKKIAAYPEARMRRAFALLAALCIVGARAPAYSQDADDSVSSVSVDVIKGWLKTSAPEARVFEHFYLILTMRTVETDTIRVVVDTTALDSVAVATALAPFEVIGFEKNVLRRDVFRFSEYIYKLNLQEVDFFGKDILIPGFEIKYWIERFTDGKNGVLGREMGYTFPSLPLRVISTVPDSANDIRDYEQITFGDVKTHNFRARLLLILAIFVAFSALLLTIRGVVIFIRERETRKGIKRMPFSTAQLFEKLSWKLCIFSILRRTKKYEWDDESVGLVLAVLRVAGALAVGFPVSQVVVSRKDRGLEGDVKLFKGLRRKKVLVSAAITSDRMLTLIPNEKNFLFSRSRNSMVVIADAIAVLERERYGARTEGAGNNFVFRFLPVQHAIWWLRIGHDLPTIRKLVLLVKQTINILLLAVRKLALFAKRLNKWFKKGAV